MGILGPSMGFDPSGPSEWRCWAKSHGIHNAPLFFAREFSLSQLEKYRIFYHVSRGFSIFGNAFSMDFGVSPGFVTLIKGCRVTDSFMSLTGFEFSVDVYG